MRKGGKYISENFSKKSIITIKLIIIVIIFLSSNSIYVIRALKVYNSFISNCDEVFEGYTLFAPEYSKKTYLIDNSGKIVHIWKSNYSQALQVALLKNGSLLRADAPGFDIRVLRGGYSGRIEMFNWDGDLIWEFEYINKEHYIHHGFKVLPNGNILLLASSDKTRSEAIAAGCNPALLKLRLAMDYIIEVEPTYPKGGIIVWEWCIWDHIIQDFDPTKNNYGAVSEHPELIDINYRGFKGGFFSIYVKFAHMNSLDYN